MKTEKFGLAVKVVGGLLAGALTPGIAHACACGCGVFDVATSSMLPNGPGGMVYLQFAYQNQDQNWSGWSKAPDYDNGDKKIETEFLTPGVQYMFNSSWGAQVKLPYDFRYFKGTDDAGNIASHNWSQLGDLRIEGIYTGFFADMSAGVTFGLKLPTGDFNVDPSLVDRDTQIGTGSTDILLGGFYRGNITQDEKWDWFAQTMLDVPTLIQDQYRPGVELDTAAGIDYKGITWGKMRITPLAQAIVSYRSSDSGAASDPGNTGYERLLLSPGVEFHVYPVTVYTDVEFPVLQHLNGDQLAAPLMVKVSASYMF